MPVTVDPVSGYPKYSGGRDSLSATTKVIIDWDDIDNYYLELFPAAVASKPSLPALLAGSTTLYADSVEFEPFVGEGDLPTCSLGVVSYDQAYATVNYKTIPYTQGGGASDQIITRHWTVSGDFLVLPSTGLKWGVANKVITDPDVRAGKIIPMQDISVRLHRVTAGYFATLKAAVFDLIGSVNNATFEGCPAETLLLLGGDYTQTVAADGTTTYECEIKFQYRIVYDELGNAKGWNHFFRPETGFWEEVVTLDFDPIYAKENFATLYT